MKDAALFLLATFFSVASRNALAQDMQQQSQSATGNWIISETTSPVDYSPVVVAITRSRDSLENPAMQLSVYCRNGQTYVVLTGPAISSRRDNYAISYSVNGGEPTRAEASPASFGAGAAFRGDVVRLLQAFPDEGEIAIRLATQTGSTREGYFSLSGLKVVRSKVAAACKWPRVNTQPRN